MSSLDRKYRSGGDDLGLLALVGFLLVGVPALLWAVVTAGAVIDPRPLPAGYLDRTLGMFRGNPTWRSTETVVAVVLGAICAVLLGYVLYRKAVKTRRRVRHDRAAVRMGSVRDITPFTAAGARRTAKRLGVISGKEKPAKEAVEATTGVFIGNLVRGGAGVWASWEDTLLHIWGTRTGKTSTQSAPHVIEAPGPVLATSNKRDLPDLTRDLRAEKGQVWVFDPQAVAQEKPTWWWNPLTYVTTSARAQEMAGHFALGSRTVDSKPDAHFDPAGKDLLASYLLAAAAGARPIETVYYWLTDQASAEAAQLLEGAGWPKQAAAVTSLLNQPERYRGSVFSTALQFAACLRDESFAPWVNPDGDHDHRPQFDPETFVRGPNTLYSLSIEGEGTAGPLVTALTVATITAAEEYAVSQRGGRLAVPMVCVLDEAANVCRWAKLPDLYSHYGSRGIILDTYLQSWPQGVDVWGESGMRKLWSTANVATYGGNIKDEQFLRMLSELIGKYTYTSASSSRQKGSRSTSRQDATDEILSVADLEAMPRGRAVMFGAGTRPVLVRTVPISQRRYATAAAASETAHNAPPVRVSAPADATTATGNRWSTMTNAGQ